MAMHLRLLHQGWRLSSNALKQPEFIGASLLSLQAPAPARAALQSGSLLQLFRRLTSASPLGQQVSRSHHPCSAAGKGGWRAVPPPCCRHRCYSTLLMACAASGLQVAERSTDDGSSSSSSERTSGEARQHAWQPGKGGRHTRQQQGHTRVYVPSHWEHQARLLLLLHLVAGAAWW
jgi:hypothetical protein